MTMSMLFLKKRVGVAKPYNISENYTQNPSFNSMYGGQFSIQCIWKFLTVLAASHYLRGQTTDM